MPLTMGSTGIAIQTIAQIRTELADDLRTALGVATLAAERDDTVIGQIVGILAERERLIQEAAQGVYTAFTLDAAGVNLERLAEVAALTRKAASGSTVTVRFTNPTGAPITVPAGAVLEITTTGDRFVTDAAYISPAGGFLDGSTTAHDSGPTPVPSGAAWAFVSTFAGSGDLTLSNPGAGVEGLTAETDAALRVRWIRSYHFPGAGTLDSLIAGVLALSGVVECQGFENTDWAVGITSPESIPLLPAKSFTLVARGGTPQEIGDTVWSRKPAGIESYGSTAVNVTDQQGQTQVVNFEAATALRSYLDLTVTGGSATYDQAVKDACVAYIDTLKLAQDPLKLAIQCEAFDAAGPDATNVAITHFHTAASPPSVVPAADGLAVPWNQWASLADADISIVNV